MSPPVCPPYYSCTFTPQHAHYIVRTVGPWWHGVGGLIAAGLAMVAIAVVLIVGMMALLDHAGTLREARDKELERKHALAIEEQRTMQADAAKGDRELLRILREDKQ